MFRVAFFTIFVSAVAALLGARSAEAALQFDFKKTEDGIPYVFVSGEFDFSDDLTIFERLVRSNSATAVTFHSPGGNIPKAIQLGRLIRSLNLITIQPRATECSSACSLAFLGGVLRFAEPGAIGVHKSSFSGDTTLSREDAVAGVQQITADIITYMIEMGVDPALLQLSLQYDSDDIRYLSKSEMAKYKVVNLGTDQPSQRSAPSLPTPTPVAPPVQPPVATAPPARDYATLAIPQARSGRIRRPQGKAPLMSLPDTKSKALTNLPNGIAVSILGNSGRWYRARGGGQVGYLHDTWVYVDQYESGPFAERHIQVKSFDNYPETEAYVRSSAIPLSAYIATNGWFAITLRDTYPHDTAKNLVKVMKENGSLPDDSYVTYGNTYVRKVCCQ